MKKKNTNLLTKVGQTISGNINLKKKKTRNINLISRTGMTISGNIYSVKDRKILKRKINLKKSK